MIIDSLLLVAFGPFTDKTLDFSSGNFQLVYGQNEAGKSSMLRAIEAVLFGIPARSKDTFIHRKPDLRVGAVLRNDNGLEISFKRRRGSKGTLRTLDDSEETLADNSLDPFLKGIENDRFRDIHCIDHEEFRAGGQIMLNLDGLAGDTLLAASNSTNFPSLQNSLAADLEELYAPRKKSRFRCVLDEYNAAKNEKAQHRVLVDQWEALKRDQEKYKEQRDEIKELCTRLNAEIRRLDQLRTALPTIGKWKAKRLDLEELGGIEATQLPSNYSIDKRRNCESELTAARGRIGELEAEICELTSQLSEITETPEILASAEDIDDLQHRIGTQSINFEERATAVHRLQAAEQASKRLLAELGFDIEFDQINSKRLQREHRVAIQSLAADEKALRQRKRDLKQEREKNVRLLKQIEEQLNELGERADLGDLGNELRLAEQVAATSSEIEKMRGEFESTSREATRKLTALPYWDGSLADLAKAPVPLRETIDKFAEGYSRVEHQLASASEEFNATSLELANLQREIDASEQSKAGVTESDLTSARERRDHGWTLVKQSWFHKEDRSAVQAFAQAETLGKAYEKFVTKADQLADRLRREADLVAERAQRNERAKSLSERIKLLTRKRRSLESERQNLQQQWLAEWQSTGVEKARSPQEMRGWIQRRSELLHVADELEQREHALSRFESKLAVAREKLQNCLIELQVETSGSLEGMLREANRLIAIHQDDLELRKQLADRRLRLKEQLATITSDEKSATDELQQWEEKWTRAMRWIGCDSNTTAAQALERAEGIDELGQQYDAWLEQKRHIALIDSDADRFAQDVRQIVVRVDFRKTTSGDELPATEIAKQLRKQLEDARRQQQTADAKRDLLEQHSHKLKSLRSETEMKQLELDEFVRVAQVESPDRLPHVEMIWQLNVELNELADEIRNMSGGVNFDQFIQKAEGRDDAELAAQIDQLQLEIDEQHMRGEEVAVQLKQVSDRMASIDGSSHTALADQRAINCLSEVHEVVGQYARLKLAECILRQQVERYREKNKDPLLAKASEYFASMTCDEFSGLDLSYDEGKPIIVGIRRGEKREEVGVSAMSDGTRDPMFLALRLAYLQRRLSQHEAMPLIVDDILIHLDDDRALATLRVLAELSKDMQVLFFTHHDRIRSLAETHLSSDTLTIHELERRGAKTTRAKAPR